MCYGSKFWLLHDVKVECHMAASENSPKWQLVCALDLFCLCLLLLPSGWDEGHTGAGAATLNHEVKLRMEVIQWNYKIKGAQVLQGLMVYRSGHQWVRNKLQSCLLFLTVKIEAQCVDWEARGRENFLSFSLSPGLREWGMKSPWIPFPLT